LQRVNLGLAVFTHMGQFVTVMNSEMASRAFDRLPGEGTVYCRLPRLSLMSGRYPLRVTLQVGGSLADQVDSAIVLNVDQGDFFGTAVPNDWGMQGQYVPHQWHETFEQALAQTQAAAA